MLLAYVALLLLLAPANADAATGEVIGSILIEQQSPTEALGEWTLLKPDQTSVKLRTKSYTVELTTVGNHTIFVEPPEGMSTKIVLTKGEAEELKSTDHPQLSFSVSAGDNLTISIQYILSRVGIVSISSDPPGVPFEMEGPNKIIYKGITPASFKTVPEGQYTVRYSPEGCIAPRPQSLQLRKDGRINFTYNVVSCDTFVPVTEEGEPDQETELLRMHFVTVTVDGKPVVFEDVPTEAWFAPFVFNVIKAGVLSGYRDAEGNPTGRFGPGNNVTIAELAKIAHRISGVNETMVSDPPKNRRARNAWFSPFIASAEQRDWVIFQDTAIDPVRPATRSEVLITLLQALDVPLAWPSGELFRDVTRRTLFAAAIETAANAGIVSGTTDALGKPTGLFNPASSINRAELAKIVNLTMEKYR